VYVQSLVKYVKEIGEINYAACCDLDPEKARSFKELSGCANMYTDYNVMVAEEKPDAVILVTPYRYTAGIAVDMIEKGCHVMIEKPPGNDLADVMKIAEAVKRKKPINMVSFNRRNIPLITELKKWVYEGETKHTVQHIDYKMYRVKRKDPDFHTTAIHGIDLVSHVARSPYKSLNITYGDLERYGNRAVNIEMQGFFASGATTQLSFNPATGLVIERITLCADDNTFFVEIPIWDGPDSPGFIRHFKDGKLLREKKGNELGAGTEMFVSNGFYAQLCVFLECIRDSKPAVNDIFTALNSISVSDCVAARKGEFRE